MKNDVDMNNSNFSYKKGVCYIFSTYWLILVVWQNISSASLMGTADAVLKLMLLVFLARKFLSRSHHIRKENFLLIFLFIVTQLVTFFINDLKTLNLRIVIYYLFPILFLLLTYGIGADFCVQEDEVETMNKIVMMVCLCAIAYTAVFEPHQFIAAFSSKTGYGSELHAFFASMNEFATYLFYSIVACVMKIERMWRVRSRQRIAYYLMALLFFGVQLLTFSRTAIVSTIVFLIIYSMLLTNSKMSKCILVCMVFAVVTVMSVGTLREYIFQTIFKGGVSNSRTKLFNLGIEIFKEGTLFQKLFGFGIYGTRAYFAQELMYGSVHNGYLQVLLYYGIVGVTFLVSFLIADGIAAIKMFRKDKYIGVLSLANLSYAILTMLPSTQIIFFSSIDCFFLTSMLIILPKYMRNAVYLDCYYTK